MKRLLFCLLLCAAWLGAAAQTPVEIELWPDGPPEANGLSGAEVIPTDAPGRVANVSRAMLYVYPADPAKNTGAAVVIAPGGAYRRLSIEHEGHQIARWLAANGITGVVLKYRMPNGHPEVPLDDAEQAMRVVRQRAAEWGIDVAKVGFSGSSSGGHLASSMSTLYTEDTRPDFAILIYPAIHGRPQGGDLERFSADKNVTAQTPKTLIFVSADDGLAPQSAIYWQALTAQKVPSALYIFPSGGHGWGFNTDFAYHEELKHLYLKWLKEMKIVP